ncbi:hypothetical protein [Microbacterium sp.]|uniref:hypothetical protein n=1 Tax=Microbacterium sp. TaxID=51671 RepID=UPI0039E2D1EA
MEYIPWFVWIVLAGIAAGVIITVVNSVNGRKSELAQALAQNAETNERMLARLDGIDDRLRSVEKTLNDIPE